MHWVPSRGVDSRVKFLDDANATHCTSFEHTPAPVLCRLYVSSFFAKLRAILGDETYSSSAFVSLQILIAFAPNPTYTFSSASVTRAVYQFRSKQERRARFEFIQHIRDLATKIARDVSTDLSLHYSILPVYEGRAMDPSILYFQKLTHTHTHTHTRSIILRTGKIHTVAF